MREKRTKVSTSHVSNIKDCRTLLYSIQASSFPQNTEILWRQKCHSILIKRKISCHQLIEWAKTDLSHLQNSNQLLHFHFFSISTAKCARFFLKFYFALLITQWILCWIHAIYTRFTTFHYNSSRLLLFWVFFSLLKIEFSVVFIGCMQDWHFKMLRIAWHALKLHSAFLHRFKNNIWRNPFTRSNNKSVLLLVGRLNEQFYGRFVSSLEQLSLWMQYNQREGNRKLILGFNLCACVSVRKSKTAIQRWT